jgi:regulator of replication initiation timing
VRKYEGKGIDGLKDGRGRTKPLEEMSETERLRMENKILKAQLKDAEMENKLLKKLRELRGGD